MTPAETEHFAALRMHVAHLHAALAAVLEVAGHDPAADGGPTLEQFEDAVRGAGFAIAESERAVADLLKDADRDLALLAARADLEGCVHSAAQLRQTYEDLVGRARAVVHAATAPAEEGDVEGDGPGSAAWRCGVAVAELAKALPA